MCLTISLIPVGIIGGFADFKVATAFLGLILVSTFVVALVMAYYISRPLEKLTKNIDEISKGNLDVELEKSEIFEVNNLTESLSRVMTSLKLAIQKVGVKKGEIFEETLKAKEAAEEKYQDLLKNIDDWAWETDTKGVYVACSAKVAETLGYTPEEIIGKSVFELMPSEEAKKTEAVFKDASKNQEPIYKLENYYIHKDGSKVRVFTNAVPVFDGEGDFQGYRGIHKNITTHVQSELKIEELIQKNKRLREMRMKSPHVFNELNNIQEKLIRTEEKLKANQPEEEFDYVFLFDEQANIVDCSENIDKKLGYKKDEMLLLNLTDFVLIEDTEGIEKKIKQIKKQGIIRLKTIHKRKDGSSVFVTEDIRYLNNRQIFQCAVKEDS
jgi:PAS domain S-box-containing protein